MRAESNDHYNNTWYQRTAEIESLVLHGLPIKERYEREVNFVLKKGNLNLRPGDKVLDVASGIGEHARLISRRTGADVTATDLSENLINQAKDIDSLQQQTRKDAYHIVGNVNYEVRDMGDLETKKQYKAITCMGTSFMYLGTHEAHCKALSDWHKLLVPGGKLAIQWRNDMRSVAGDFKVDANLSKRTKVSYNPGLDLLRDEDRGDGFYFKYGDQESTQLQPYSDLGKIRKNVFNRIYIDEQGEEHDLGKVQAMDYMKKDAFPILKRMLEEAGFKNIKLVPNEKGDPLSPDGNVRMFAVTAEA
ncbi:class I SAM-dependent methyltransferase [Patescibacteria group bacterium]|nr:class I SAM-dependent methyltransferase [Patescibacteria group bacterium]